MKNMILWTQTFNTLFFQDHSLTLQQKYLKCQVVNRLKCLTAIVMKIK